MTKYTILNEEKSPVTTESHDYLEGNKHHLKLFQNFSLHNGANLKTPLEALVLSDDATGTEEELRAQARYVVSVDLRNQWVIQKNHNEGKEAIEPLTPKTLAKIEEKYGSEREYRQEIRRFLKEEFLGLFLPFLEDKPMTYSPYSGIQGGVNALGGICRMIDCMGNLPEMPSARVVRYLDAAQFYVSEDEFSFKGDRNAWASLLSIHIKRKAEDSDEYKFDLVNSTSGKFWANPLLEFSKYPDDFEKFVEMLKNGPQGTTFSIKNFFDTTRFFTSQDPVTIAMADYMKEMDDEFTPAPEMDGCIQTMIESLKERNMLMHDPSLEYQLKEKDFVEVRKKIRKENGL